MSCYKRMFPGRSLVVLLAVLCMPWIHAQITSDRQQRIDSLQALVPSCRTGLELAGVYQRIGGQFGQYKADSAIAYYDRALALAETYGTDSLQALINGQLVEVLYAKGELWRSMRCAYKAERIYLARGDSARLPDLYNSMGNNLKRQHAWGEAIGYYRMNQWLAPRFGALEQLAYSYMNLGECYLALDMLDSALCNEELAEALMDSIKLNYRGAVFTRLGRIHARLGHRELALDYCRRAVTTTIAERGEDRGLPSDYVAFAGALRDAGKLDSAIVYAKKSYSLAVRIPVILDQESGAALIAECYAQQGRIDSAYRYLRILSAVKDSIQATAHLIDARSLSARVDAAADSVKNAAELRAVELQRENDVQRERTRRNIFLFAGLGLLVFAVVVFRQRGRIQKALHRSDELLLNILPEEVAEELKAKGHADAKHFDSATILFSDFKGFTALSETLSPTDLVQELNVCFKAFDGIITARGIEKIKTIGDAYMCVGGLPDPTSSTPADVVHAALEMQAFMCARKTERDAHGEPAFDMRVGIHTGPVVAGIVGVKKFAYDIWGDTVNIASRMESSGEVGQVNISESTYALVKDEPGLTFTPRGKVQAKGKGEMEMYFVRRSLGADAP